MAVPKKKESVKKDSLLSRVLAQRTGGWLKAGVDQYLEDRHEFRSDPGWFHPSALANPCDAFLAFAFMGLQGKGKITPRLARIFDNGTGRDEYWKQYLHESGISLMKHWGGSPEERELASLERQIEIGHCKIRGEFDDKIYNASTGETYIFEFKTMNCDEWAALKAPKTDHVLQAHCYMFGTGVLQAMIVYECKNCQDVKTFIKRFDGALWHSIEARALNIIELIQSKQMPWRTPMQYDSRCQFHHLCGGFEYP